MDPADSDPVGGALKTQGQWLHAQEEQLGWLQHELGESNKRQETTFAQHATQLNHLVDSLGNVNASSSSQHGAVASYPSSIDSPRSSAASGNTHLQLSSPERFSGESGDLSLPSVICQAVVFPSGRRKMTYIISYLSGRAKFWNSVEWYRWSAICKSLPFLLRFFKLWLQVGKRQKHWWPFVRERGMCWTLLLNSER